jgi:hypothetical protein
MAVCVACRQHAAVTGVLCEECASDVRGATQLCAEQIMSNAEDPRDAALIDRWGHVHTLGKTTVLGRRLESYGIQIAESSISRHHVEISLGDDGRWRANDLKSRNGTYVNEKPVVGSTELKAGDILFFGQVGMFFLSPAPTWAKDVADVPTMKPAAAPPANIVQIMPEEEDEEGGDTFLGLSNVDVALVAPSGGGGGVIALEGRTMQLTAIQFELLRVLADRMFDENGRDERVRGFVRSSELLGSLPWDTARPEDNHIKQLVRRVRRGLVRSGIGDLIESRHGFGYRLRVKPVRRPLREGST